MKKGQATLEFLIVVALVLTISSILAVDIRNTTTSVFSLAQVKSASLLATGVCEQGYLQGIQKYKINKNYVHLIVNSVDCELDAQQIANISNERSCERSAKGNLIDCGQYPKYAVTTINNPTEISTPDLVPVLVDFDSQPAVGKESKITVVVTNQGKDTIGNFVVYLAASSENIPEMSNPYVIGTQEVGALGQNEYRVLTFYWTPMYAGEYPIALVVDRDSQVAEQNENNNNLVVPITVVS